MASPEKISYTFYSIPNNNEFNPLYKARILYNTHVNIDSDLYTNKFKIAFENNNVSCHSLESYEFINQFADYSSEIIGTYSIYNQNSYYCDTTNDEYYRDDLIILTTKHPIGGFPIFPMYNYDYDFIYQGAIEFPINKVFYGSYDNLQYYQYFARFKVEDTYVFIKSRALLDQYLDLPEVFKTQVDYIYGALTN